MTNDDANILSDYAHLRESVGLLDRSDYGRLTVTGPEALTLLDRLLSSEVSKLGVDDGQPTTLLSAKGKVLGYFTLYRGGENDYTLLFPGPLPETFLATFQKYSFLNDVEVHDSRAEHCRFHVEGPLAGGLIERALGAAPPVCGAPRRRVLEEKDPSTAIYNAAESGEHGFAVEGESKASETLWTRLLDAVSAAGGGEVCQAAAEIYRVENGIPRFGLDFDSDNFPNEAGIENALTYTKCYVGQEVVARMRTYGHVNRKLRGLKASGHPLPDAASGLFFEDREVGRLGSWVRSPRFGVVGLALVHRQHWDPDTRLTLRAASDSASSGAGEREVVVTELPFA